MLSFQFMVPNDSHQFWDTNNSRIVGLWNCSEPCKPVAGESCQAYLGSFLPTTVFIVLYSCPWRGRGSGENPTKSEFLGLQSSKGVKALSFIKSSERAFCSEPNSSVSALTEVALSWLVWGKHVLVERWSEPHHFAPDTASVSVFSQLLSPLLHPWESVITPYYQNLLDQPNRAIKMLQVFSNSLDSELLQTLNHITRTFKELFPSWGLCCDI